MGKKKLILWGDKFLLNTKILSIVTALVMVAGLGAIAADSAAPVATTCHQKICKTNYMPVNKRSKGFMERSM